jgi:hypothetical protein
MYLPDKSNPLKILDIEPMFSAVLHVVLFTVHFHLELS